MTEERAYKRYPKEFKGKAVALVREQGYSVSGCRSCRGYTSGRKLEGTELSDDERDEHVEKSKSYAWKREILKRHQPFSRKK